MVVLLLLWVNRAIILFIYLFRKGFWLSYAFSAEKNAYEWILIFINSILMQIMLEIEAQTKFTPSL